MMVRRPLSTAYCQLTLANGFIHSGKYLLFFFWLLLMSYILTMRLGEKKFEKSRNYFAFENF